MEVVVLKYMQIVCITIFMNNANCAQIMVKSEEMNNIKVAACAADCIKTMTNNLTECYQHCANQTDNLDDVTRAPKLNATFGLYCRDSHRLLIQVDEVADDVGHVATETFIYLLIIQETKISFVDRFVYISDKPLIELSDLKPSESYNISAVIVSSDYGYYELGTKIFTTLKSDYQPENVTDIWVEDKEPIENDVEFLNVVIGWKPARDQTCSYEFIMHGLNIEDFILTADKSDRTDNHLYYHKVEHLKYSTEYSTAVRGVNTENKSLRSFEKWFELKTPSCWELNANSSKCGPEEIPFLTTEFAYDPHDHKFSGNVTWGRSEHQPEFYVLEMTDMRPKTYPNGTVERYSFIINGNATEFLFENIVINGSEVYIKLTSHLNNRTFIAREIVNVQDKIYRVPRSHTVDIFFYTFVVLIAIFIVVLFRIWQKRINSMVNNFTQKQIDNMDLDLIKTITNRSMLEAIADLTRDETMEIERENIALMEALGEGAFGLVKKAVLVRDGSKHQVAVKMLKNSFNIDDIKQFHQEISVMKSVGKHPNIVSIIGHCTSNIEELMLLTEFCDAGSLLDLLRSEFAKQLKFYDKKHLETPAMSAQKYPDNLHNFDGDEKETSYKNFGCTSRLFVINQMYDDLNNNDSRAVKAIEMTATNALYLELCGDDPQPVVIDITEPDCSRNFLFSRDLISFAKQVSDGMEFLARKKVVHRDLAARNILVCSDKTAKIADFGLSRDIYQDNIYRKLGNGKLPIKWLAMESMTHQVYTSQSDVWSFGILLYEIVTLGATPYPSIGAEQLLKILHTGYRMEKPKHCHKSLYDVMMTCWHANASDRPTFEELSLKLNHFLKVENSWNEQFIDLPKLFEKCTSEMNYMKPIA